ncbi:MAG TPA: APC family permease [Candidatus Lumbricidophila sp.]|nr:APC family permease [Candidatus Lumbricidophila sp.]
MSDTTGGRVTQRPGASDGVAAGAPVGARTGVGAAESPGASEVADVSPGGRLGLWQGTAFYVASVFGTGVLVLPGLAAAAAGPASILAVALVFALSVPLAGTFAALASRYPDAGGIASYARRAFGDTAARMAGYWFYFGIVIGAPIVATAGGNYVAAAIGLDRAWVPLISVTLVVVPLVVSWFGVRVAGWMQFVLVGLLLAVVAVVVAVTVPVASPTNFEPAFPHGAGGVLAAMTLFIWAFAGWEVGTHIAGEFKNPARTIPIATGIAVVIVGAAYLTLQVVTVAVLGDRAGDGAVPLLSLIDTTARGPGSVLVAAVTVLVTVGVFNSYLSAFGKLGAALGRDGDLPRFFALGAAHGAIPRRSLLLTAGLVGVYWVIMLALGMDLGWFISMHSVCMLSIYLVGSLAALRMLRRFSAGWWMALAAAALTAALLATSWRSAALAVAIALAAVVVTVVRRARVARALRRALASPER